MDAEHRTGLIFFAEAAGSIALLAVTTFARAPLLAMHPGSLQVELIQLAPIIPVWLMLVVSIRHYFRIDEYQRLKFLQIISLSAGILLCVQWSWPYAQHVFALAEPPSMLSWVFAAAVLLVTAWLGRPRDAARAR